MRYLIVRREDYLAHHGIKGQKWGIRRYQNPDGSLTPEGEKRYGTVENFKRQTASYKEIKNFRKTEKARQQGIEYKKFQKQERELEKKAYALAKKYNFDADDGGGGKTAADRKAGREYMKIWDKIQDLEIDSENRAISNTTQSLINKYGQERMDRFYRQENRRSTAAGIAFIGGYAAAMIGLIYSVSK